MTRILLSLALLIQREDRSPSPAHSKPVPPPKIYTEEKGEKTIQESHEKKWYQRLFSWRTSQRAVSIYDNTSKEYHLAMSLLFVTTFYYGYSYMYAFLNRVKRMNPRLHHHQGEWLSPQGNIQV